MKYDDPENVPTVWQVGDQTQQPIENFERKAETWVNLGLHPHTVSCYYVRRLGGIPRIFTGSVDGGGMDADFGYTGHLTHASTGLALAPYRSYDANLGRWLSRDRLRNAEMLPEGPNLYVYVANRPNSEVDPIGLACGSSGAWWHIGADWMIPDSPGFDFTDACERHDACYGRCGASKASCDTAFHNDMAYQCASYRSDDPRFHLCNRLANSYHHAVVWFGGAAYRDAQKAGCCAQK
jgi:RHS repeat-associated protein